MTRALNFDQHNFQLARNYTFQERRVVKALDKNGSQKHLDIQTYDVTILYDEPYSRLIQKNDKPLTEKEEQKEEEKLDKFIAKHKNESEKDRQERAAKREKERHQGRAFSADVMNAYDFRLSGEEQIDGRDVYVIEAEPRKDFHPTQPHADILSKIRGKVWIDKKEYGWVKVEAETLDTISWGLLLFRIHKGSKLKFEQTHLNDEIWLPRQISVSGGARIAVLVNSIFEFEDSFSNYKKFGVGSRILPGVKEADVPPDAPK